LLCILQYYGESPKLVRSFRSERVDPEGLHIYRVSVSSLFILVSFDATLRSMVRSPTSTMSPPRISGWTY